MHQGDFEFYKIKLYNENTVIILSKIADMKENVGERKMYQEKTNGVENTKCVNIHV